LALASEFVKIGVSDKMTTQYSMKQRGLDPSLSSAHPQSQRDTATAADARKPVKLVKHFDLIYWWVVWLYAAGAWFACEYSGLSVSVLGKTIKLSHSPLVGLGFVFVLLFTAIFVSVRARGAMSAVLLFSLLFIGALAHYVGLAAHAIERFADLRVHMNQAFFGVVTVVLFPAWLLTTFVFNRLKYIIFHPGGGIEIKKALSRSGSVFFPQNIAVRKLDDDIFVHRILGLGTGDIVVTYTLPGSGINTEVLSNVWRADRVRARITENLH
jgi:hypothetical protein